MSLQGLVDPILCINKDHLTYMAPYWNSYDSQTELKCLTPECEYKIIPGINLYEKMIRDIERYD